jgi:putative alpha-1,2-mannosidase
LGYVPSDIGQSAARTLEYAYNDWCIYQMGKKLGRPASELDIYKKRSQNYKNLFYAPYRLMSGKDRNGNFRSTSIRWNGGDLSLKETAGIIPGPYSMICGLN